MSPDFAFFTATPVLHGAGRVGALDRALHRLGERKLLIVTDQGVVAL